MSATNKTELLQAICVNCGGHEVSIEGRLVWDLICQTWNIEEIDITKQHCKGCDNPELVKVQL